MVPARHRSVSPRREPYSAAPNRTVVGSLEPTAQVTNNLAIEDAARQSALAAFGAASMMPVPSMTQAFMPGGPIGLQPLQQVPIPQKLPTVHRNVPTPIALTAGALMPEAQQMGLCQMCGLRPRVPGFEVCSAQCRASLAMLNNVDISVRQYPEIPAMPALGDMLTPEALRSVLAPPPTPPPVATNVQALAVMPQLPQDVLQMMASARPDQQQAFLETLLARQQRQKVQAEPGKAMSSAGPDQPEPRRLFQRVVDEPDWTEPAVRLPEAGMPQTFGSLTTEESRQMQVDMDHHFAATLQPEEDGRPSPTEREAPNAAVRSDKTQDKPELRITGARANWGTLNFQRSRDPVMNMVYTLHARGVTHKWKQFVLQVRGRAASEREGRPWLRPGRWLAGIHGTETASWWGHLGPASKVLRGPKGSPMYK